MNKFLLALLIGSLTLSIAAMETDIIERPQTPPYIPILSAGTEHAVASIKLQEIAVRARTLKGILHEYIEQPNNNDCYAAPVIRFLREYCAIQAQVPNLEIFTDVTMPPSLGRVVNKALSSINTNTTACMDSIAVINFITTQHLLNSIKFTYTNSLSKLEAYGFNEPSLSSFNNWFEANITITAYKVDTEATENFKMVTSLESLLKIYVNNRKLLERANPVVADRIRDNLMRLLKYFSVVNYAFAVGINLSPLHCSEQLPTN